MIYQLSRRNSFMPLPCLSTIPCLQRPPPPAPIQNPYNILHVRSLRTITVLWKKHGWDLVLERIRSANREADLCLLTRSIGGMGERGTINPLASTPVANHHQNPVHAKEVILHAGMNRTNANAHLVLRILLSLGHLTMRKYVQSYRAIRRLPCLQSHRRRRNLLVMKRICKYARS